MEENQTVVELFVDFLNEVRRTYGEAITDICRSKLLLIKSPEEVDVMAILAAAKKEANFDPVHSSLAFTKQLFTT